MRSAQRRCAAKVAHLALLPAILVGALLGANGYAAVPVEESVGQRSGTAPAADPAEARRLTELFYQLQVLQQEMRELRGLVEQQGHQIKRMARDQQEQYIDLDRRLTGMRGAPAAAGSATAPAPGAGSGSSQDSSSERDAYTAAFNLMKEQQFDASASAFNKLIMDNPNGAYTPNAFYWLGELYLAKTQYEKARQSFAQVTNLYPDHQKVPDALYKLGVVYHQLGDTQRSLEFLNRVRSEHPQSSAAGLAQTYADAAELR